MSAVRVLLVDDHPVVRAGMRALLASHDDIMVVAEASSGEEAVASASAEKPDVVLMDLRLGSGIDGAQATARILTAADPPRSSYSPPTTRTRTFCARSKPVRRATSSRTPTRKC